MAVDGALSKLENISESVGLHCVDRPFVVDFVGSFVVDFVGSYSHWS